MEKTFSGQSLCSCAFGANIHSYRKQRARHGTPFLQPPSPPPSAGVHVTPLPPRRAIFRSPSPGRWSCWPEDGLELHSTQQRETTPTPTPCGTKRRTCGSPQEALASVSSSAPSASDRREVGFFKAPRLSQLPFQRPAAVGLPACIGCRDMTLAAPPFAAYPPCPNNALVQTGPVTWRWPLCSRARHL